MRVGRWLLALSLSALAPLFGAKAQTSPQPPDSSTNKPVELDPIIVDANSNFSKADAVLSIGLDSKGSIARAKAVSGPKDLATAAIADARMFRYPEQANASGLTQRVLFRYAGDEVRSATPDFPTDAKKAHAHGWVKLVAAVGPDGHVTDVTVVSGHPLLQNPAENALRKWVFTPVLKDGVATPCHAVVNFNFDINQFPN